MGAVHGRNKQSQEGRHDPRAGMIPGQRRRGNGAPPLALAAVCCGSLDLGALGLASIHKDNRRAIGKIRGEKQAKDRFSVLYSQRELAAAATHASINPRLLPPLRAHSHALPSTQQADCTKENGQE